MDYPGVDVVNSCVVNQYYEILFKQEFLLLSNAQRSDAEIWGTDIYCDSSDLLKGIYIKKIFSLSEFIKKYN